MKKTALKITALVFILSALSITFVLNKGDGNKNSASKCSVERIDSMNFEDVLELCSAEILSMKSIYDIEQHKIKEAKLRQNEASKKAEEYRSVIEKAIQPYQEKLGQLGFQTPN